MPTGTYLLNRDLRRITSTESRNDPLMAMSGRTATSSSEAVEWLKWDRYTNASFSCRCTGVGVLSFGECALLYTCEC